MTFVEAKTNLKKLAANKYYTLRYEFTGGMDHLDDAVMYVYIDGQPYIKGYSWADCLCKMELSIKGELKKDCDINYRQCPDFDLSYNG